jgi:hypothetical protein
MATSKNARRSKKRLYAAQSGLCVDCFMHWPLEQMRLQKDGDRYRLICIGCHPQGHAN